MADSDLLGRIGRLRLLIWPRRRRWLASGAPDRACHPLEPQEATVLFFHRQGGEPAAAFGLAGEDLLREILEGFRLKVAIVRSQRA